MKRSLSLFALSLILIAGSVLHAQDTTQPPAGQRQGGGRGPAAGPPQGAATQPENQLRLAGETINNLTRVMAQLTAVNTVTVTSTWWNNANTVAKLGLTDVQKARIESTFEAHRQNLASRKDQLEKEEAQLSRLLDAESIDRGSVFTQINRVVQARGEMERANATMTLEMREQLTRAQWTQLQTLQPRWTVGYTVEPAPIGGGRGGRGARSGQ